MGVFSINAITDRGRNLLADVQAGAVFIPTRIVMGSGYLPSGSTAASLTDVVSPVTTLDISKVKKTADGKVIFGGVYKNDTISTEFYFRELALFARAEYRDADGNVTSSTPECMYSYGNAADSADLMPAYSTGTVVERNIDLVTWAGNNTKIELTVDSGVCVHRDEFDEHAERHSESGEDPITPEMIGAIRAFGRYGGGTVEVLDTLTTSGSYSWLAPAVNPFGAAAGALFTMSVDCPNYGGNPTVVQTITQTYAAGGILPVGATFRRCSYMLESWTPWIKLYDANNKPTPKEIGAVSSLGVVPSDDLIAWANAQTIGGSFLVSPANTTKNVPAPNAWFIGTLDVLSSGKRIFMTDLNSNKAWVNVTRNENFTGWVEHYNALNPPEKQFVVYVQDSAWQSDPNGGFFQTANASGILATDYPIADVILGADTVANALMLEAWGCITRIGTANGTVTLYANDSKPISSFNMLLKVVR